MNDYTQKRRLMQTAAAKIVSCMSKEQRNAFNDIYLEKYESYEKEAEKIKSLGFDMGDYFVGDCGLVSLTIYLYSIPEEEKTALLNKFEYEESKRNGNR